MDYKLNNTYIMAIDHLKDIIEPMVKYPIRMTAISGLLVYGISITPDFESLNSTICFKSQLEEIISFENNLSNKWFLFNLILLKNKFIN